MTAFEVATTVFLGVITLQLVLLAWLVWRLGEGLRGLLRLMPAVGLLEQVFAGERPEPAAPGGGRGDREYMGAGGGAQMGVHIPFDAAHMGRGTFTDPGPNAEEVADMLARRERGE